MSGLSVVVITKNEERRLAACLESVAWADEIIVVDDQSTDRTLEVARRFTDKVTVRRLESFGRQKQFAVEQAQGPWVLSLDADERVPPELAEEIRRVLSQPTPFAAFRIPRRTFYLGKWIRYGNWSTPVIRLLRKDKARFNDRLVHEAVDAQGAVGELENFFVHGSYESVEQHMAKLDLYTTLDARTFFQEGRRVRGKACLAAFVLRPAHAFLRKYLLQRAFLDGWEGLLISWMTAFNVLVTHMKLWDLTKEEARQR